MAIIDKFRGVDILSPQLGEESARETVEWLQDEMEPLAGNEKLDLMWSRIDVRFAQVEAQVWRAVAAGVAIILTAIGIATALIIAFG